MEEVEVGGERVGVGGIEQMRERGIKRERRRVGVGGVEGRGSMVAGGGVRVGACVRVGGVGGGHGWSLPIGQ